MVDPPTPPTSTIPSEGRRAVTLKLVKELLHALKLAASDAGHAGFQYGRQSVVAIAIRKGEKFLEGGQPTCFGSKPDVQARAENDCDRCFHELDCLAENNRNVHRVAKVERVPGGIDVHFELSAFNKQEGGDHYRGMKSQPFVFVRDNNVGHAEGEAIYRLLRWRDKGGIADLKKVIHTVELIIEYEEGRAK